MTQLTDELLKCIEAGTGRCYPHEGKAMATELLAARQRIAELTAPPKAAGNIPGFPWVPGVYP